jgi:hypothetical protein
LSPSEISCRRNWIVRDNANFEAIGKIKRAITVPIFPEVEPLAPDNFHEAEANDQADSNDTTDRTFPHNPVPQFLKPNNDPDMNCCRQKPHR